MRSSQGATSRLLAPPAQQRVGMSADTARMSACATLAFPKCEVISAQTLSPAVEVARSARQTPDGDAGRWGRSMESVKLEL